ncbi:glycosyl transferase [Pasteurellaceae bacterium 15-036681]|nr:glycosyl transferase [Pasteurellaceae bacterium 15-036681]
MTTEFNPVAIIPHYNHSDTLPSVVEQLLAMGLPVIVVDDGSNLQNVEKIQPLAERENVQVLFQPYNGGKGVAMKVGLQFASFQGFSHALQIDADGQHRLSDALIMLEKAQQNPNALICGAPVYGEDAPKARLYGRKITDFWNMINTHSKDLKDGMCGFRIYPLVEVSPILQQEYTGNRMDFDIEILVKCHWQKIPMIWVDTPVKYEQGGISHFRGLADNWLISKMHARLFFGMLIRSITGKSV